MPGELKSAVKNKTIFLSSLISLQQERKVNLIGTHPHARVPGYFSLASFKIINILIISKIKNDRQHQILKDVRKPEAVRFFTQVTPSGMHSKRPPISGNRLRFLIYPLLKALLIFKAIYFCRLRIFGRQQ